MQGSRPARAARTKRLWWWLGGAAVVAVAIAVLAVSTSIGAPVPSAPTATATSAAAAPTPSVEVTPTTGPTPTATPTPTTPSASATRPVKKAAYCAAFAKIKARSVDTSSDGGGVDFDKLAALFASLTTSYSAAAKSAPSSLDREYAQVLGYLKEMRKAVVSRDLDGIKLMIKNLELLNGAMTSIQTQSEKICG
jgi:hypothetical protein